MTFPPDDPTSSQGPVAHQSAPDLLAAAAAGLRRDALAGARAAGYLALTEVFRIYASRMTDADQHKQMQGFAQNAFKHAVTAAGKMMEGPQIE
jgi:hypothetical protein